MEYTKIDYTVTPYHEVACQLLIDQLADLGFESFCDTETGFEAYIPSKNYKKEALSTLYTTFEGLTYEFTEEIIPDQNWNKKWEENYFQPIIIGDKCVVRSPFHDKYEHIKHEIIIEPKMAFGTGHHSTTSLMMQHILENDFKGKKVLDMGCGTGLLGILASMCGATEIDGIDIDDWAYNNAIENLGLNNITNMKIHLGGAELLNDTYDIILANINRNILLEDIHHYTDVLKSGGKLFLSGFYNEDLEAINQETTKNNLVFDNFKTNLNWVAAKYTKK